MRRRLQLFIAGELDARIEKAAERSKMAKAAWVLQAIEDALQRDSEASGNFDAVARLASLSAPTSDVEQMIAEIGSGRS
jgi:hypothetical protein